MIRQTLLSALAVFAFGGVGMACKAGGVGDPCIPNDEFSSKYGGATETGAAIEDRSFQCETRVCLIKHFRGRVSCPFGNTKGRNDQGVPGYSGTDADDCVVPGTNQKVEVPVQPQCADRKEDVYCSCRCDGTDTKAKYCECPSGFKCEEVTKSLDETLVRPGDKYCVKKEDTFKDGGECLGLTCDQDPGHCGYSANHQNL